MTKPKKPAAPAKRAPLVTPERMAQAWHTYPRLTLATVGTFIVFLTSIAPFVSAWYNDFVHRKEFNDYKAEALTLFNKQDTKDAWRDVRAFRMEATVARNRINDCNVMRDKQRALSPLEKSICAQYEQDLIDANRRAAEAQAAALAATNAKDKAP